MSSWCGAQLKEAWEQLYLYLYRIRAWQSISMEFSNKILIMDIASPL
jgi:hypothetical protein